MNRRPGPGLALLGYAAITVALTWPQAWAPGRMALPNGDLFGHAWGLAWVVRQAFHDPLHLYDSNMYFPHSLSLAYTESLLPQALLAAPLLRAGADPVLAHNLVVLLTLPLCGLGAYLLAHDLCRSRQGAFLAGLGYAFGARHWLHLVHVGVLSVQWLPLSLLFFRRAVRDPGWPNLAGLVAFSVLQILSSGYYAVALALALGTALLFYLPAALRRRSLLPIALAALVAGSIAFAAGWPYQVVQRRHAIQRSRQECIRWSAGLASYLNPGHYMGQGLPSARLLSRAVGAPGLEPLYPGFVVLSLAAVGLVLGRHRHTTRLSAWLVLVGVVMSLGPELRLGSWTFPGPFDLIRHVPPVNMLRAPARLGVVALLGLALLAASGWARIAGRSRRWATLPLLACLASYQVAEAFPVGLAGRFRDVPAPPAFAGWLASAPRGAVLELPWDVRHGSGRYMYWSTAHWQPMVNGHGTYYPPGNRELALLGRRWPRPSVARVFRGARIRYVVVHMDRLSARQRAVYGQDALLPPGVTLAFQSGADRVYVVDPEGETAALPQAGMLPEDDERPAAGAGEELE
jgi:hypothetical protein